MAPSSIVEDLDVIEHIRPGEVSGFIDSLLDPFLFQTAEEGLCHRVDAPMSRHPY